MASGPKSLSAFPTIAAHRICALHLDEHEPLRRRKRKVARKVTITWLDGCIALSHEGHSGGVL